MTIKKQRTAYFNLRALTTQEVAGVTGPKFTKFVAVVIFSSTMLMQQSAL